MLRSVGPWKIRSRPAMDMAMEGEESFEGPRKVLFDWGGALT